MKNSIVTFLLSLTMLFPLAACGEDDGLTEIRLSEVTHSIFYAPLYIAINNGYMTEAGIKIELSNGGGARQGHDRARVELGRHRPHGSGGHHL